MFGSQILEVILGMAFVFGLLSLIASAAREALEAWLKTRSRALERGIRELLSDPDGTMAKSMYDHPLVSGLFRGKYADFKLSGNAGETDREMPTKTTLPAYIPTRNFALALLDIAANGPADAGVTDATALTPERIREQLATNLAAFPKVQRAIVVALDEAKGDLDRARVGIEAWYDSAMDRVSGWYKRDTQSILWIIGIGLAVTMNVDSLRIASALSTNDVLRKAVVAEAEADAATRAAAPVAAELAPPPAAESAGAEGADAVAAPQPLTTSDPGFDRLKSRVFQLNLPIGWPGAFGAWTWKWSASAVNGELALLIVQTAFGWLLTAAAVSFGAPFWFDLLNKIMVVRSTVKPHEKSGEEASDDRVAPAAPTAAAAP